VRGKTVTLRAKGAPCCDVPMDAPFFPLLLRGSPAIGESLFLRKFASRER
jgi:hypothetical protein